MSRSKIHHKINILKEWKVHMKALLFLSVKHFVRGHYCAENNCAVLFFLVFWGGGRWFVEFKTQFCIRNNVNHYQRRRRGMSNSIGIPIQLILNFWKMNRCLISVENLWLVRWHNPFKFQDITSLIFIIDEWRGKDIYIYNHWTSCKLKKVFTVVV